MRILSACSVMWFSNETLRGFEPYKLHSGLAILTRVPHLNEIRSGGWVWVQLYLICFQVGTGISFVNTWKKRVMSMGMGTYGYLSSFEGLLRWPPSFHATQPSLHWLACHPPVQYASPLPRSASALSYHASAFSADTGVEHTPSELDILSTVVQ